MSKDQPEGAFVAGWLVGLPLASAAAREKGRLTLFLLAGSGRLFAMAERRANGLHGLACGERPAGFRVGADLGVDRDVLGGVVGMRGAVLDFTVVNMIREVFMGFVIFLTGSCSSSSEPRLRFVDELKIVGSMFSVSTSERGCLLPDRIAPDSQVSTCWYIAMLQETYHSVGS